MKTYKNNYRREKYKTFIADIRVSNTGNSSDTLGDKTAEEFVRRVCTGSS